MEWLVDITSSDGLNLKPPLQVHVLNACSLLVTHTGLLYHASPAMVHYRPLKL